MILLVAVFLLLTCVCPLFIWSLFVGAGRYVYKGADDISSSQSSSSGSSPPSSGSASEPQPTWNKVLEWDFPGHDIGQPYANVTAFECQNLCKAQPTCVAGAYSTNLRACWLKDSLSVTQPILPGNRAVFLREPAEAKLKRLDSMQTVGDPLFTVFTPNDDSCKLLCHHNGFCRAATFYKDGSNRCVLMRTGVKSTQNPQATSFTVA